MAYTSNTKKGDKKPTPLEQYEISVHVYLLLQSKPKIEFSSRQVLKILNEEFNDNITYRRIQQILQGLAARGLIYLKKREGNRTNYFRISKQEQRFVKNSSIEILEQLNQMRYDNKRENQLIRVSKEEPELNYSEILKTKYGIEPNFIPNGNGNRDNYT